MTVPQQQRFYFLDHLRGFMFLWMAIDHSLHAYAQYWGRFWFFKDHDRSHVFDALYLHDQSILMPMLFFIFGLFVLPSLERRGVWGYLKERSIRLGIPYILGIILMVPILVYPKYIFNVDPDMGFLEFWLGDQWPYFWQSIFFSEKLQGGGPFWVLMAMFFYSLILVALVKLLPWLFKALVKFVQWGVAHPVAGFFVFGTLSAVILGISDLRWGAPWWVGLPAFMIDPLPEGLGYVVGRLFSIQASRFLLIFVYFVMGAAVYRSGVLENKDGMKRFADQWPKLAIVMGTLAVAYVGYSLMFFHDGAYSDELHLYLRSPDWDWSGASTILGANAFGVLIRTTLHGFFCLSQALFLLAFFYKFVS